MPFVAALLLGVVANLIWGMAFLIPYCLPDVDPVLLTAGRYGTYGLVSVLLLLTVSRSTLRGLRREDWLWALALAFAGNVGYYVLLVSSIRLGGMVLAALIVGTLPVTLALYGNRSEREFRLRRLALPLGLIFAGLVAMNGYKWYTAASVEGARELALGTAYGAAALALWTWYGVKNAQYLKRHPHVSGPAWSAAVGAGTLALMAPGLPLLALAGVWSPQSALALRGDGGQLMPFLVGSLVLGVVVSWLATWLWNAATRVLSVSLAGQLVVFESLSSIAYASLVDGRLPPPAELGCMAVIFLGVVLGIRATLPARARGRDFSQPAVRTRRPLPSSRDGTATASPAPVEG